MECLPLPVESLREECFTFLQATLTDDSLWHSTPGRADSGRNTFGKARDESLVLICGGGAEWVRFELSLPFPLQPQTYAWLNRHGFKMLNTSRLRHAA